MFILFQRLGSPSGRYVQGFLCFCSTTDHIGRKAYFSPHDVNNLTKLILNYQEFPFTKRFSCRFIRKPKFVGSGLLGSPAFEQTLTALTFANSVFQRSFALIISIWHWFQAVNLFKNLLEQGFRHQHLCHLKRYISSMTYHLGPDLNQFFPHGTQ